MHYLKHITLGLAALFLVGMFLPASAQSQPNQVHITWRASNFYPSYFEGKALPTFGSPVTVAVEVTRSGVLLDLSQANITWEIDGKFVAGGQNVKQAQFVAAKGVGDTHFVRVSVVLGQERFESSSRVPVAAPIAAIDAPYPNGRGEGGTMTLSAVPFFFNVSSISDLSFSWLVDGERLAAGNDHTLTISNAGLFAPRSFQAVLEVISTRNSGESASRRGAFILSP